MMTTQTTRQVVSTRECNLSQDSYFYATFYNGGTGISAFSEEMIGSTAFSGGVYNMEITASQEVLDQYNNEWLPLMYRYNKRFTIMIGSKVYAPKARKYKSMGRVLNVCKDAYDSREWVALVDFDEGQTWMRTSKLVKFQEFISDWEN